MPSLSKKLFLALIVFAVAVIPLPGAILRWGWPIPGFGVFPPNQAGSPKPPFNVWVFVGGALVAAFLLAVILFPRWFGFHRARVQSRVRCRTAPWPPWWFWAGLAVNLVSWLTMWFGSLPWAAYSFVPLWWGFIVAIDGLVYWRANKRSLLATEFPRLVRLTIISIPAWYFFEFLNYYAIEFWVYPNNRIFSPRFQTIWFLISFSTVWPAVFEWYTLLHTFDDLWNRWSDGPVVTAAAPAWLGLVVGGIAMAAFGAFPFELFALLWIGPPLVMTSALALLKLWTPFRPIREGNWSPLVLVGLAALANGVFWELWNYGSIYFRSADVVTNPNYWFYDIPYVDLPQVFSKMPVLGYFGYLPFGALAWVFWLVIAHGIGLEPVFDLTELEAEPPTTNERNWRTAR